MTTKYSVIILHRGAIVKQKDTNWRVVAWYWEQVWGWYCLWRFLRGKRVPFLYFMDRGQDR